MYNQTFVKHVLLKNFFLTVNFTLNLLPVFLLFPAILLLPMCLFLTTNIYVENIFVPREYIFRKGREYISNRRDYTPFLSFLIIILHHSMYFPSFPVSLVSPILVEDVFILVSLFLAGRLSFTLVDVCQKLSPMVCLLLSSHQLDIILSSYFSHLLSSIEKMAAKFHF